jgi:hypothetical protein
MAVWGGSVGRLVAGWRGSSAIAIALGALLVTAIAPSTAAAQTQTRYTIAGGCYNLLSAASGATAPGATTLRFQASDLGSYLLYRQGGDFLAAGAGDTVGPAAQPSPAADWVVEDAAAGGFTLSPKSAPSKVLAVSGAQLVLVPRSGAGDATRFNFAPASGCAAFPEAELNVSGTPSRGETSYGEVSGLLDGHMHWMNFEYLGGNFHCGRPWSPYGIPDALPDCSSIEGPAGAAAPMQNFLNYGNPVAPHDTSGWPKLTAWARTNLTYDGVYWRWVQRDWMAGERLMVMPVNENRVLCQLQANRKTNCDEMATARQEIDDIYKLQNYVDAQAGGPGQGFFQIVTDPFEARHVINEGKMAVVLEVEISEPFGCRGLESTSTCSQAQIDSQLQDLYDRGVRSSLLLNKFDNPLTGVRFDSGEVGVLINDGNKESSGSFWSAETCQGAEHDNEIFSGPPTGPLATLLTTLGVPGGTAPAYPPAPHCNTRGLTSLGAHTVEQMMDRGMIVNPDHMSQRAVDATIRLAEQRHYSGVISPHGWMDPRNWPRIWALGGMAFPNSGSASGFVEDWRRQRPAKTPYYFGWGWGADLGGLATQGAPVPPDSPARVTYPFKSLDGAVTVDRQRTGQRVFDYSNEGVAHYGLYADWTDEVRKLGGQQLVDDLLRGPEAYLQMWERSVGVPATRCLKRRARLRRGLGPIRLGMNFRTLLQRAGQPIRRKRAWTYCVKKSGNRGAAAVLTPGGTVALVASDAPRHRAGGIRPGTRLAELRGRARSIGGGVWVSRKGKKAKASKKGKKGRTRIVYLVRKKRVRTVAIASRQVRGRNALRRYMRLVPSRGMKARRAVASRHIAAPLTEKNASPLVQQHDPARFELFCNIGL